MTIPLYRRAAIAAAAVLAVTTVTTGAMAGAAQAASATSGSGGAARWTENLALVQSSDFNVAWTGKALTVKDGRVHATTSHDTRGYGQDVLPAHSLAKPVNEVAVTLKAGRPSGSEAHVDVRGLALNGKWTEWVPAAATGATRLSASVTQVQARLTLWNGAQEAAPSVSSLTLSADYSAAVAPQIIHPMSVSYQVYATREGLVGGTTANGHVIQPSDHFVALPSGTALSPNGSGDYSVQVCGPSTCETAPVWDIGPWNTRDDYWDASRAEFTDLPQGEPEAQAAYQSGYNGGEDQFGRTVSNPAGIDLADGTFYNIGLNDNGWVTVTYLWTGGGGSGPSVTGMGQCATSSANDCWNTAAGNGSDCYSGHFCIYTGTNYTGTVFSFYHCKYNGGDWALQNWLSAGSYINDNSGGSDAYTKDQNHNVITASAPGNSNSDYNFNPVYYVQAC